MQDLGRLLIWLLCQQDIIDDPLRITIIIQWKFRAIFKTEQNTTNLWKNTSKLKRVTHEFSEEVRQSLPRITT